MKLIILFALAALFSAVCALIFTNPNKYSKCCEPPADQPLIGIFGVCLYLIGLAVITAAFTYGPVIGYAVLGVWFGVYFAVRYYLKREQREYKLRMDEEKRRQQEAQKLRSWF